MSGAALEDTIGARLATLSAEAAETIARNPGSTILPADASVDSRQGRALDVLVELGGDRSEPFRIERTLGEGGMGVVHLAEQRSMGRSVAVKTLKPDHRDPISSMRLLREAWVTGFLEHPNIVPVYDVAVDGHGAPQVVLKRIEGVDWATLLESPNVLRERADGDDTEEWNIRTLVQVCNAVHFAHDRGIIHRDLKPENVMIGKFGEVYVVDWGIAVSLRDDGNARLPRVSAATDLAGTPLYMAPEMLSGDPSRLSERTDVYLLGAILFELATGRPPHQGPTLEALFVRILQSPPDVPSSVPGEIAAICRRAMALEPEDRYASVTELRRALGDYLEHRESMNLARKAQRRLTELLEELREVRDSGEDSGAIHHLFGECRFGFRAALEGWAGNDVAQGGLRLAIKSMAEHELASGNLQGARLLMNQLGDAPEDLRRGLRELERSLAADSMRREHLEALGRELDPSIGSRTRVFVSGILGLLWTLLPLWFHFLTSAKHIAPDPRFSLLVAAGSLPIVLGAGYWARESMMKTVLNRRTFALLIFTLVANALLSVALILANVAPTTSVALNFFLWFTAVGTGAIMLDARLWPAAAGYCAALFASLLWPHALFLFMSASHAVLTANAIAIWKPVPYRR